MIKRKLSRSPKGEYTLTLSGLNKTHVQLLYSIFSNISLHRCKGIADIGISSNGISLPYECLETLIPLDFDCVHGQLTGLGITQHSALRELLSAFPLSADSLPLREFIYHLNTFQRL